MAASILFTLAGLAGGQDPGTARGPFAPPDPTPCAGPDAVLVDEPGDGNVWGRGASYKASFGPDGVDYVLFLGSAAPRNFPLGLRLEPVSIGGTALSATTPVAPRLEGRSGSPPPSSSSRTGGTLR